MPRVNDEVTGDSVFNSALAYDPYAYDPFYAYDHFSTTTDTVRTASRRSAPVDTATSTMAGMEPAARLSSSCEDRLVTLAMS